MKNMHRLRSFLNDIRISSFFPISAHYNRSIEDLQKQCCSIALQQSDQEKRVTGFEQCHQRELRLFRVIYHHTVVQEGMAIFDDCQETTNKLRDNYSKVKNSVLSVKNCNPVVYSMFRKIQTFLISFMLVIILLHQ